MKKIIPYFLTINLISIATFSQQQISPLIESYENHKISIKHNNEIIWKYSDIGNKELNQYRWDLILNKNQNPYHIHYNKSIKKEEYILILETEDTTHEKKLIINESN